MNTETSIKSPQQLQLHGKEDDIFSAALFGVTGIIGKMEKTTKAIVACAQDKSGTLATTLQEIYQDVCNFEAVEFTNTLHKAIQSVREEEFNLCFIDAAFPPEDLSSFFADYERLDREKACVFIQVHEKITEKVNVEEEKAKGFHCVVSRQGTHNDKTQLEETVENICFEQEITDRKFNISTALNVMLRKIDDAARNLKRGVQTKIDAVPSEFLEMQTTYDDETLDGYYQKLEDRVTSAEPENADVLDIPANVLKRDLPKLEKDKYTGASNRVWKKLLRKHGVKEE